MTFFLSINTDTHRFIHTTQAQPGWQTSVRPCGYEFSSLFHFYSSVSSFSRLMHPLSLCSYSLLSFSSSLIVFHHLSIALLFCCSFKLIAFLSVSFSFISTLSRLVCLSPSGKLCLYFSRLFLQMSDSVSALRLLIHREKAMGREWQGERGKGSDKERSRKRDAEGGVGDMREWSSSSKKAKMR